MFKNPSKTLAIILLIAGAFVAPFAFFLILFGLSGSDAQNFLIIALGFAVYLVSAFLGLKRGKFLYGCLVGVLVAGLGMHLDKRFWREHNDQLCSEMRADDYCLESEMGFICTKESSKGAMSVGRGMCSHEISAEAIERQNGLKKQRRLEKNPEETVTDQFKVSKTLERFEVIVNEILGSADPANLDYESELVAVYNCLGVELSDPLKGENFASQIVARLAKSEEQKAKYYRYHQSKGRNINTSILIASLPAGDSKFDCAYLLSKLKGPEPK